MTEAKLKAKPYKMVNAPKPAKPKLKAKPPRSVPSSPIRDLTKLEVELANSEARQKRLVVALAR
jgi:hypothetical protein